MSGQWQSPKPCPGHLFVGKWSDQGCHQVPVHQRRFHNTDLVTLSDTVSFRTISCENEAYPSQPKCNGRRAETSMSPYSRGQGLRFSTGYSVPPKLKPWPTRHTVRATTRRQTPAATSHLRPHVIRGSLGIPTTPEATSPTLPIASTAISPHRCRRPHLRSRSKSEEQNKEISITGNSDHK